MYRSISLFCLLMVLWLLLSGIYTLWITSLGVVSCLLVVFIAWRMDVVDHEGHPIHLNLPSVMKYWRWLIFEIVESNWLVIRCIMDPKLPISPAVIALHNTQKTDLGRVMYANSITLTPGTVTLDVEGDVTEVHALTREVALALRGGEMDRRVTETEGE